MNHGDFCTRQWYRLVEEKVATCDGQGHSPDLGSEEWQAVVEFKLGVHGHTSIPPRNTDDWCRSIDQLVRNVCGLCGQ